MKLRLRIGLIILFLIVSLIPPVGGNGWPEEQTRHIQAPPSELGMDSDMFVTEAGIGFSSVLVTVLDPNMDIYAGLFFKDMKINYWFHLVNATLRLHTASSLSFDADSSFTIYGINDYRHFGLGRYVSWAFGAPSTITGAPLTSAHVNYNSSEFYGGRWWDIDVTNIVQELKSNPHYDGPGLVYANPGDNMGFIILGAGGHDTRYFYDLSAGNGFEAQLHLHWDFSPPPPSGYEEYEYIEDYGNFTIWRLNGTGAGYPREPIEYVFTEGTDPYNILYDDLQGHGPYTVLADGGLAGMTSKGNRKLVRTSNGTLFATYFKVPVTEYQIYVKRSADEGETWTDETLISTAPGMSGYYQQRPVIAVDSNDWLHVVWYGKATAMSDNDVLWYAVNDGTWQTPVRIGWFAGSEIYPQTYPSIAIDSNDYIHLAWQGTRVGFSTMQIHYSNYTTSWSTPIKVSDGGQENRAQGWPDIAIDTNDHIHVVWMGESDDYFIGEIHQIWYSSLHGTWETPLRISTAPGMGAFGHADVAMAISSDDHLHVTWSGLATGHTTFPQIWYALNDGAWQTPDRISDAGGMEGYAHADPNVAVDSDDDIHVLWEGADLIWYAEHTTAWQVPFAVQPGGTNSDPKMRWSMWPSTEAGDDTFIVADGDGDVIAEDLDSLEDAEDWIDLYDTNPEEPDPGGQWSEGPGGATGPFSRFRIRLYILVLGFGCIFGPVLFFSWRRPTGYYLLAGALVMMAGLGLLMAIGDI